MTERPRLPVADRGLIIKFATIALWSVLFAAFLPEAYRGVIAGAIITLLTAATVAGAAVAVIGIVRHDNLVIEVAGLYAMLAAPFGYLVLAVTVASFQATQGITDRIAVSALALLQLEVIVTRLMFLLHRRRSVKTDNVPAVPA